MIVIDLETTGLDPRKNCILSIGAVHLGTGKEFYEECSTTLEARVDPAALEVNGFVWEDILPGKKQTPAKLYWHFCQWAIQFPENILAGHNIGHFDILFLEHVHSIYFPENKFPFSFRTVDLHSLAYAAFGVSMKHSDICRALGLPPEPKPHNALEGAKSEAAAFRELLGMNRQEDPAELHLWCRDCHVIPCSCAPATP